MASDALPHLFRTYWVGLKKNRIANEYRWVTGERPSDAFLENITGKRMVELLSNPRECFFLKKRKRRLRLDWCNMSNRYLCQRLLSTPIVPSKVVLCQVQQSRAEACCMYITEKRSYFQLVSLDFFNFGIIQKEVKKIQK